MSLLFDDFISCPSRAVDEDDEYEDDEKTTEQISSPVVRWSPKARDEIQDSRVILCSSLLVATGTAATGFIQVHLLSTQPCEVIGVVCCGVDDQEVSTLSQEAYTDHTCFIYRLVNHPGVIAIQCKVEVATGQLFSWTEQVLSKLCSNSTSVTVLSTSSIVDYKSSITPSDLPVNFLRSLQTSTKQQPLDFPLLEQPNVLTGLPAQVLTYCQVHHLPCILYLCFTDLSCLRSETVTAFRKLISCPAFKDIILSNPDADKELAKLCDAHARHTALYI